MLMRFWKHFVTTTAALKRTFPPADLTRIEAAVAETEANHDGQVRVVLEASLSLHDIWRNRTSRNRAMEVFALEHVWDTAHNTGVLIYVLWADRRVEIIADRGIHAVQGEATWQNIADAMQRQFSNGQAVNAVLSGISAIKDIMPLGDNASGIDDLPNRPSII